MFHITHFGRNTMLCFFGGKDEEYMIRIIWEMKRLGKSGARRKNESFWSRKFGREAYNNGKR